MSVSRKGRLWFKWMIGIVGASLFIVFFFAFTFWLLEVTGLVPRLHVEFPLSPAPLPPDFERNHLLAWLGILMFVTIMPLIAVFVHVWKPQKRFSGMAFVLGLVKGSVVGCFVTIVLIVGPFPVSWETAFPLPVGNVIYPTVFLSAFIAFILFPVSISQFEEQRGRVKLPKIRKVVMKYRSDGKKILSKKWIIIISIVCIIAFTFVLAYIIDMDTMALLQDILSSIVTTAMLLLLFTYMINTEGSD